MKYLFFFSALLGIVSFTGAEQPIDNPARWTCTASLKSSQVVKLRLQAHIDKGWHVYSPNNTQEYSPIPASLTFSQSNICRPLGKLESIGAVKQYEPALEVETELFRNQAILVQQVRLLTPAKLVSGMIKYMACTDKEGICVAREVPFRATLK